MTLKDRIKSEMVVSKLNHELKDIAVVTLFELDTKALTVRLHWRMEGMDETLVVEGLYKIDGNDIVVHNTFVSYPWILAILAKFSDVDDELRYIIPDDMKEYLL